MVWLLPLFWLLPLYWLLLLVDGFAFPERSVQGVVIQMGLLVTLTIIGGVLDVCRVIRNER